MRKHIVSLTIVVLLVAASVAYVVLGPHPHPHGGAAHAAVVGGATPDPAKAATPAKAPAAAPPTPAAPALRTPADGQAALAKLTPAERAELAPLAKAFAAAARAAALPVPSKTGAPAKKDQKVWDTDRKGIQGAIRASVSQMKGCYDPWLEINPKAGGRIVTTFRIGAPKKNGVPGLARITQVKVVKGGLGNRFLDGCVLSVLSGLRFKLPPGGGNLTVNYPLTFRSAKPAAKGGAQAAAPAGP